MYAFAGGQSWNIVIIVINIILMCVFRAAESCLKRSLAMRETLLDDDHLDIAQSLNNLAALYSDLGQCHQAMPLYVRALDIRQKVPLVLMLTFVISAQRVNGSNYYFLLLYMQGLK